jgi:hypothetical protein
MELEKNKTYLKIEKAFTFPHLNKEKKRGGGRGSINLKSKAEL